MSFVQKIWKDRVSENPARRTLTPTDGSAPMEVDVTRTEGTILEAGDALSAANMNDLENRITEGIGGGDVNMAPIEESSTASQPYAVGELLIYEGQLYRVTAAIATGNSLVEGVNITTTTLAEDMVDGMTANGSRIYMDYQNGKYGYNTSPNRGADTFHPFSSSVTMLVTLNASNSAGSPDFDGLFSGSCYGAFSFTESESLRLVEYTKSSKVTVQHTDNTWKFSVGASVSAQWHNGNTSSSGTVELVIASV